MDWLLVKATGRRVIDVGAGSGHLSRLLREAVHPSVIAIDIVSRPETETAVQVMNAAEFGYAKNDLAIIARPCRGDWIEGAIRVATDAGSEVIYIGRRRNLDADLGDLIDCAAWIGSEDGWAGEDGEVVLSFVGPLPEISLLPGEQLIQLLPYWKSPCPMRDDGDRWRHRNGAWFPKAGSNVIIHHRRHEP